MTRFHLIRSREPAVTPQPKQQPSDLAHTTHMHAHQPGLRHLLIAALRLR
jgi:hypothetical protein